MPALAIIVERTGKPGRGLGPKPCFQHIWGAQSAVWDMAPEPASDLFNLNTTDFELFMCVATHKKLPVELACTLMQIVCEVAVKHIMFTRVSLKLVLTILARFNTNEKM